MSGGGGSGSGGGGGSRGNGTASAPIPAVARKMVQSLKEIVTCGEPEIYAMLKECNMDPDEAVHRLLSQDTFHEVKSKREKKKELKENPESRSRAVNSGSSRVARVGVDRGGRYTSSQFSSNDYGVGRSKLSIKKENETNTMPTSSILGSSMAANNLNQRSTGLSDSASSENVIQATIIDDGISLPTQPSSRLQQNWMGMSGHVSMADIVKMGRPQGKPSSTSFMPGDPSYTSHNGVMPSMSHHCVNRSPTTFLPSEAVEEFHSSQGPVSHVAEISHELGTAGQHISHNDWIPEDESPAGSGSTVIETSGASASYVNPSTSSTPHVDELELQLNPHLDEILVLEGNVTSESLPTESIRPASVPERQIQLDNPEDNFVADDGSLQTMSSYQSQRRSFEHDEVEEVNVEISSAATNLQKLRLHKEELPVTCAGDNPAVIIPSHLQVTGTECSHLSFGSFGSGINAPFSGSYSSKPQNNNMEVSAVADAAPSLDHSDTRILEYYGNGQLQSTSNDNVASRSGTSTRDYDMPSASQPETIRNDSLDATHGLQYDLPSVSGYAFPTTIQQNTATYTYPEANSQIQNLPPFPSLMQPYTDSLPSTSLAANVQPLREFDHPFSSLLPTQSMPTKYSTAVSTVGGPTISIPEVKPGVFSSPQSIPQTLPGSGIHADPRVPQHLPIHPYSQPTLPLGPFTNMISYSYLPQSYAYLPSAAFQQAYAGNGPFHQSAAAVQGAGMKYTLPQYKSGVSVTNLPHSAAVASGYGGFGSSTSIPGSFALNPSSTASSTTLGFDEALQYKEGNHYAPHQQTENSAMWIHGGGSRAVSALPSSTFYSFQGQNQHSGYRQGQQPSNFGAMGYPNLYHSQAGASGEHQPNPIEGSSGGSQGSQQSHHIWQHGY